MICGNNNSSNYESVNGGNCIVSTLMSVAEAQEIVEEDCRSGCQQAIDELKGRLKARNFDTIPVLLTNIGGAPFSGVGALRSKCKDNLFNITRSFLFRVNDVDEETGCAALELLKPVSFAYDTEEGTTGTVAEAGAEGRSRVRHDSAYDEFLEELSHAKKIVRTGICITVDLADISAVNCLPPIHTV